DPDFAAHARDSIGPIHSGSGLIDSLIEGLQKAGLQIPDAVSEQKTETASESPELNTASVRAASGEMWIAVLPFQHAAGDPEIENFEDGLTQDITAALSQFSYLSVVAQDSTQRMKDAARYVIQGGIRKSGSLIRVNVQLVDSRAGTNL